MNRLERTFTAVMLALTSFCLPAFADVPLQPPQTDQILQNLANARVVSEETLTPSESGTKEAEDPSTGRPPGEVALKLKY